MKTLSKTNYYLKDKATAKTLNAIYTRTSCVVEGIVERPSLKDSMQIETSKSQEVFLRIKNRLHHH